MEKITGFIVIERINLWQHVCFCIFPEKKKSHVIVLRRKVRRTPGRRTHVRRPVAQERIATVVRIRRGPVVRGRRRPVVVVVLVVPLRQPRFTVAWPRYDTVWRVGVLPEHSALERLTGLDRLSGAGGGGDVGGFRVVGRAVPVGVHRPRRRPDRRHHRVFWIVVTAVLIRRLVDVFGRPVTAYRVHAVRHALPRRRAAVTDGSADFLTRPRRRSRCFSVVGHSLGSGVNAIAA